MKYKEIREKIINAINEDTADDVRKYEVVSGFLPILEKYDGKQCSRRIYTALKPLIEKIPGYKYSSYGQPYNYYQIEIDTHDKDFYFSINLGYTTEFSIDKFNENNACYLSAALERIEKNKNLLKDVAKINRWAKAIEKMYEANEAMQEFDSFDIPAYYAIQRATRIIWR